MKSLLRFATISVAVLALLAVGAWVYMRTSMHGFSARAEPSHMEAMMADYARATAMPSSAKNMKNPVALTPAVQQEALAHFADHCAVCHGNNGDGQTMFGKGMYPKPPDLRDETQTMSDGEIFYDIENGIRMSGMPAFGGEDSTESTWKLVHFIRHLPKLTTAEEAQMEALNPKGPDEWQEEKDEQQFLDGGTSSDKTSTTHHMKGHTK
ncbi:MAG: c-type cytochrome [Acidobacteriota bacterium]|nr:c-type cytochrome [Acidobacteriota bacterium]